MKSYELDLARNSHPPWPLVVILPILGRLLFLPDFWVEKRLARYFNRHGFASCVMMRDFFVFDRTRGIEQVDQYLRDTLEKTKTAIHDILKSPQIDRHKVASLGISFGAVINVLLMAEDPRIKAGLVALAGGNLPGIMASAHDPLIRFYFETLKKGFGMDTQELTAALKKHMTLDPLGAAASVDPAKVLMVSARWDRVVLPRYSNALWEALAKPRILRLPLGHYFSLLALPYLKREALAFFRQKMALAYDA